MAGKTPRNIKMRETNALESGCLCACPFGFSYGVCQLPLLGGDLNLAQFMLVAVQWSSLGIPSLQTAIGSWVRIVHSAPAHRLFPNLARDPVSPAAHCAIAATCGGLLQACHCLCRPLRPVLMLVFSPPYFSSAFAHGGLHLVVEWPFPAALRSLAT